MNATTITTTPKIDVLAIGYSDRYPGDGGIIVQHANCTCTLVRDGDTKIIIDTMTSWDSEIILKELAAINVHPNDINYVISTHGHSDHFGCNYLFKNAVKHYVGKHISYKNQYYDYDYDKDPINKINDNIHIVATPGHTLGCISVIVRNAHLLNYTSAAVVAICGDLFEKELDIDDSNLWLSAGSENSKSQRENRLKIAKIADVIIPGHGPPFSVTDKIIQKLENDILHSIQTQV